MSDRIATANDGKRADLALQVLGSEMEAVRKAAIERMKQMYRAGTSSEVKMLSAVAELCALDDLESKIRMRIRRGDQAIKEMHDE